MKNEQWCRGDEMLCLRAGRAWPIEKLAEFIGKSPDEIRSRYPQIAQPKNWTQKERETLRALIRHKSLAACAAILGATPEEVAAEAERLGLIKPADLAITSRHNESWTQDEISILRRLREGGKTRREIATRLGRTEESVKNQIEKMRDLPSRASILYSAEEDQALLEMRRDGRKWNDIASALGRSLQSVRRRARTLGHFG